MTRRASSLAAALAALLAALAAGLPAGAAAWEYRGQLGLEYRQDDTWDPGQARLRSPRLDLGAALQARGSIDHPGFIDWDAGVGYRRIRSSVGDSTDEHDQLDYRLRSAFFQDPRSPLGVTLQALRQTDDYSATSGAGTYQTQTYGADLRLAQPGRPVVEAGYSYLDVAQTTADGTPSDRSVHTARGSVTHGTATLGTNLSYRGQFSTGTFATDNFDDHNVSASANVALSPTLVARVLDTWYRRTPTVESPFNARQELSGLSASLLQTLFGGDTQQASYTYAHGFQAIPGRTDEERLQHRLAYLVERRLDEERWRARGTVDATYSDLRGDLRSRFGAQTLRGLVYRRFAGADRALELRAGPSVGVLEAISEDPAVRDETRLGYGATTGVRLNRTWAELSTFADYEISWSTDLGEPGTSVRQALQASAEGPFGTGLLHARLLGGDDRRDARSLAGATRYLTGDVGYRSRRYQLSLLLSLQDGTAGALTDPFGGGSFIAPSFRSHSRTAALSASGSIWGPLGFQSSVRATSNDLPDRPSVNEYEGRLALEYGIGALRVAVEDRYVVSETSAGRRRFNEVFLRAYRVFGSRF